METHDRTVEEACETMVAFLTVEDVLEIRESQLERFGGGAGLRDRSLLESAVAKARPAATA